jgi:hypothetical protein
VIAPKNETTDSMEEHRRESDDSAGRSHCRWGVDSRERCFWHNADYPDKSGRAARHMGARAMDRINTA